MKLLQDHCVMPESLAVDNEVSFTAKGLYAFLLVARPLDNVNAHWLAMHMRENEDAMRSALKELEAKGYVEDTGEPSMLAPAKVDKRDPDVQRLMDYFESKYELKMPRQQFQRRAAKTLIQRYGIDRTIKGVDAAYAVWGERYAPVALNLEALRDKWDALGDFYRRNGKRLADERELEDRIQKMTGPGK